MRELNLHCSEGNDALAMQNKHHLPIKLCTSTAAAKSFPDGQAMEQSPRGGTQLLRESSCHPCPHPALAAVRDRDSPQGRGPAGPQCRNGSR